MINFVLQKIGITNFDFTISNEKPNENTILVGYRADKTVLILY